MGPKAVGKLSIMCGLALILTGCVTPDTSPTATLASVSRNAAQFGARARNINAEVAIITYSGQSRGFMTCEKAGSNVTATMLLDTRTEVISGSQGVSVETFYVATTRGATIPGEVTRVSVTFSRSSVGDFGDGTTCRATGALEQALLSDG
jgi:hypothetical protein